MTRPPAVYLIPPAGHVYDFAGDNAGFLREAAERIRGRHSRLTSEMVEIGGELTQVKNRTEHGLFLGWLEHEVGMEPRLAQKYMRAAEWASENTKLVSYLQPTAVMELAAKSTPPAVIDAVNQRIDAGESVSPTIVRQLLSDARNEDASVPRLTRERVSAPVLDGAIDDELAKLRAENVVLRKELEQARLELAEARTYVPERQRLPKRKRSYLIHSSDNVVDLAHYRSIPRSPGSPSAA